MVTLTCWHCGKSYQRRESEAGKSRFCSNPCRARANGARFAKDLTGQRFGRLTAISPTRDENGHTMWSCQCDCGTKIVTYTTSLLSGRSKSCGCWHREYCGQQAARMFTKPIEPGTRFARLTVLDIARRGGATGLSYRCRCDCGKEVVVQGGHLQSGHTLSCSCYSHEMAGKRMITHGLSGKPGFSAYRHAIRREVDSEWTPQMSVALLELQPACVVCGDTETLAVDHVLPVSKGHGLRPGNAAVLCRSCNSHKHDKDLQDLDPAEAARITAAAEQFRQHWQSFIS